MTQINKEEEASSQMNVLIDNSEAIISAHRLSKKGRIELLDKIHPFTIKTAVRALNSLRSYTNATNNRKKEVRGLRRERLLKKINK